MEDRNIFKNIYNKKNRGTHNQKVDELIKRILEKFPKLKKAIRKGFGTVNPERVEYHSPKKFDPNITISPKGKDLCYIRVVNLKVDPKKGLWVLTKKYDSDKNKSAKTWYYFSPQFGDNLIIDLESIKNYEGKQQLKTTINSLKETFYVLPYTLSKNESSLFWWIEKELKEKFPEYSEN